ncbi:TIGR01212 family radical SAM protein [Spirochaeta africana]|uniref:Putative Fe-S oxidoreductase n=1 Tax=Spirochaeta africana (strain ATCC 700263 / DSM 8902 / Z-7692) TaxID=889378 RepID=H9UI55_SPIAZ|nr:TIGR01212 family radical SAM protein [Spirochaeta africana]AFG37198.1 putative Fe-S oxidoreductase [Spirochaeta africana DSM 8902]
MSPAAATGCPPQFRDIPYLTMGRFLQQRFGHRVFKIGVDAGFSCPHRGSDRRRGGCSFCSPDGARSPLIGDARHIPEQIQRNAAYWRERYPDCRLMLYFQAYTSTLAPTAALRRIYRAGLEADEGFVALVVGTRPDCLPDEVIQLLAELRSPGCEVWVELGLQSSHEESLQLLARGHSADSYRDAAARLAPYGIPVVPHLIFGIPGEGQQERQVTLEWVQRFTPGLIGVKIHNLLYIPGTPLHRAYMRGELPLYTLDDHLEAVADALSVLPPHLAAMRLTADIPGDPADIPGNPAKSPVFTGRLQRYMREQGLFQGCRLRNQGT